MTRTDPPAWDRSADLRSIESTYARYAASGRSRLWDVTNRGYGLLSRSLEQELVHAVRASLVPGSTRILDLGCGSGDLAEIIPALEAPVEWTGLDLRDDAIDAARRAHPQLRFLSASADAVPEDDHSFDVVIARLLFSSLPSRPMEVAVAAEVRRLLRPGGWLAWVDLRYPNPWNDAVHGMPMRRMRELFSDWQLELRSVGVLPPLARLLGPMASVLYPALSRIPPLHSHLVGRLAPPGTDG